MATPGRLRRHAVRATTTNFVEVSGIEFSFCRFIFLSFIPLLAECSG